MVLVDTSVWIDFLRGRNLDHVKALQQLLDSNQIVVTTPTIVQEILQGANSRANQNILWRWFSKLACMAPSNMLTCSIEAARLFLECRLRGQTPRSSNDCLIAYIAIEHNLLLLHNDRDFDAIARADSRLRFFEYP